VVLNLCAAGVRPAVGRKARRRRAAVGGGLVSDLAPVVLFALRRRARA